MGFAVHHRELLDTGTDLELTKLLKFLKQFLLKEHNEDGTHITNNPTSGVASAAAAYVTIGNTADLSGERSLVGTSNQITVTDNGANSTVVLGTPQSIAITSTPTFANIKDSGLTAGRVTFATTDGQLTDDADLTFATDTLTATKVAVTSLTSGRVPVAGAAGLLGDDADLTFTTDTLTTTKLSIGAVPAAAASLTKLTKKVTGIADNVATDILTVTVPNSNHAASIRLMFLSSNGSTDAFESSRCASGMVVVARTTGVNAVAAATAISDAAIATVAAGATHTLAYDLSAVSGAVGATNTFTIRVTVDDSGNVGGNQLVVFAELLNAEATGITVA